MKHHVVLLRVTWLNCWLAAVFAGAAEPAAAIAGAPDFERDVAPILVNHCLECHHAAKASGQLNLATSQGLAKGGRERPGH